MTKKSSKLLSIILTLALVFASAFALFMATTPKTTTDADTVDYRGKVVIWDYYASNPLTLEESNKADGKVWATKYMVLKNTTDEPINIENWRIYYVSASGSQQAMSYASKKKTFEPGTEIPANGFIFFSFGTNITTYPSFITDSTKIPTGMMIKKSTFNSPGKNGTIMLTTEDLPSGNITVNELSTTIIDMLGTGTATSYLGSPCSISNEYHLLRTGFTGNNSLDYTSEQNYWNSDTDNSLSYLTYSVDSYISITAAKAETDSTKDVAIKALITHYDSTTHTYTMQDTTGAMLVTFPTETTPQTVGTTVLATGKVSSGVMTVDSTDNFVRRGNAGSGTLPHSSYEATTIVNALDTTKKYENYAVYLQNVNYSSNTLDDGDGHSIAVDGPTISHAKVSVYGIVRTVSSVRTLVIYNASDVLEYKQFAYGELDQVRALINDTSMVNVHFSAQGYVTYVNGADMFIEDTVSGIQVHGTALGNSISYGDYVIVDGIINEYTNHNVQIAEATLVEKIASPTETQPSIHALADDTAEEKAAYMHRSISIDSAIITATKYANNSNLYEIHFGNENAYEMLLDVDNSGAYNFETGDSITIVRGLINYKQIKLNGETQYPAVIKCNNNNNYIIKNTNSVPDVINNTDIVDNDEVIVKGTVTYVDTTNNYFILQGSAVIGSETVTNGIVVNYTNGTTKPEGLEINTNSVIKVTGTITKTADYPYITATALASTSIHAEDALAGGTLNNLATLKLLYADFGTLKVTAVVDAHTFTVTDGTNTATLKTIAAENLHVYDYFTLKGVVYHEGANVVIVSSSDPDVVNAMTTTKDFYTLNTETDKNKNITMRGQVIYIEIDHIDDEDVIENIIIQNNVDGVNYATLVYFRDNLQPADSIALGDTLTLKGKFNYINNVGRRQLDYVTDIEDLVHMDPSDSIEPEEFSTDDFHHTVEDIKLSGRYVKFTGVKLLDVKVDDNGSIVLVLSQNNVQFKLFVAKASTEEGDGHPTLAMIQNILLNADIYINDTFNIEGNLGYYKPATSEDPIDGIRLEVHLAGLDSLSHYKTVLTNLADSVNYTEERPSYTITFKDKDGTTIAAYTKTQVRGSELVIPQAPEHGGHTFVAWVNEGETISLEAGTHYNMPTSNLVLTAKYNETKYTLHFELNGSSEVVSDIPNISYGSTLRDMGKQLPNPKRDGYTFGGWFLDEEFISSFGRDTAITDNTTLYARWISGKSVTPTKSADVTLVIILSVSATLVVVGVGIVVTYLIKSRKKK